MDVQFNPNDGSNPAAPFVVRPGFGEMPVGAVSAFAGALGSTNGQTPSPLEAWGWMLCDGRTLSTHEYPELFAVLGHVYGGSGDQFSIPDYRGYFLRGIGTGTQNDPDIDSRTAPPGGQGDSSGVGSVQSFAVQSHEHSYKSAPAPSATSPSGSAAGAPSVTPTLTTGGPVQGTGQSQAVRVSANETRPLNVYVNYIIKFTYGLVPFGR